MTTQELSAPHLVFVVNQDWFFLSHRLPLAVAALRVGFRVTVVAVDSGHGEEIRAAGLGFIPLRLSRGGTSPLGEMRALASLGKTFRALRPDLVHNVTVKPVLYGSLAARVVGRPAVVNAVSGLGYVFTTADAKGALRKVVEWLYRVALANPRSRTIFQNPDDREQFIGRGLLPQERSVLIRGSGVNCAQFHPTPEPPGEPVVILPARMLRDKGVVEFVEAARDLRRSGVRARFCLVGRADPGNPSAVDPEQIASWVAEGVVEWWGHRRDMAEVLAQSTVVVLPSRREGLPKALLEAAAAGRPMIASDVPGCREVVLHEVTGLLVPPEGSTALAAAIRRMLEDADFRRRAGTEARALAESQFAEEIVVEQTLALYRELLGARYPAPGPPRRDEAGQIVRAAAARG